MSSMIALASVGGVTIFKVEDTGALTLKNAAGTTILSVDSSGNIVAANVATPASTSISGGAAGDHTVTGITTSDILTHVIYFAGAGSTVTDMIDLTSEFSISAADTINNTGGTATTGGKLLVMYMDVA